MMRELLRIAFLVAVMYLPAASVSTVQKGAVTPAKIFGIDDVVLLVQSGVSEDVILARLRRENRSVDLSAEDIVRLKKAGASDNIIRVMLDPKADAKRPAPDTESRTPDRAPRGPQPVTQGQAETAVAQGMQMILQSRSIVSRGARATVRGVNQTSDTSAVADLLFQNAVSDCGSAMGPANAGSPFLMKSWTTGRADFKYYTGRGWVLAAIDTGESMCTGTFALEIPLQDTQAMAGPSVGPSPVEVTTRPEPVTQADAEAAVAQGIEAIKRERPIVSRNTQARVRGMHQRSATSAVADLVFHNAVSDCGAAMGPANAGSPFLMKRWGIGRAEFAYYTGRGWVLTEIQTDEVMCSGSFRVSIPVASARTPVGISPNPSITKASGERLASPAMSNASGVAAVYIYRDIGLFKPTVFVNGEEWLRLPSNRRATLRLSPGTYVIQVDNTKRRQTSLTVEAGRAYYLKYRVSLRDMWFDVVDASKGATEFRKLLPVDGELIKNKENVVAQ